MTTGQKIKAARKAAGLTQIEASNAAGMFQPQWSRAEAGGMILISTLERIAAAIKISVAELIGDNDK